MQGIAVDVVVHAIWAGVVLILVVTLRKIRRKRPSSLRRGKPTGSNE